MRAVIFHPLGLTLLIVSLLLAGAMRFLPGLERWAAQASWIVFWGLLAYTTSAVALLWSRSPASGVRPQDPSVTDRSLEVDLTEAAMKGWLRLATVQHPVTLLPLAVGVASASYLILLAPAVGGGLWVAILLALSIITAAGSFLWRYVFRYSEVYARRVQELTAMLDLERARVEQAETKRLRELLKAGFATVDSAQGTKALTELDEEYSQLQPVLEGPRDYDSLSIAHVPALAGETYRRGLSVLADALELIGASRGSHRGRLETEIAEFEVEIESWKGVESQKARTKIREERLASHRQRLDMLDWLQVHIDQLLYQAGRCEASLHRTRIELAAIRAGSSETSVDSVTEALQETIQRAKEVQQELKRLGY